MGVEKILVVGFVWPEPKSSAAGKRMLQIVRFFMSWQVEIHFACSANSSEKNELPKEIITHKITLNDASFDTFVTELNPTIVLFDRFLTEEQYGWRVRERCPHAVTILDTEDLHSLRRARKECYKKHLPFSVSEWKKLEDTKREIASILRTDLSLIISEVEMTYLLEDFSVPKSSLFYLPLFIEKQTKTLPSFRERNHFVTMGNFLHEPNYDSALYLKKEIWPLIRKELPKAVLHIYGSYLTPKASQLNQPKEGFLIKGAVEDENDVFRNARVCLAPLRFGAGVKGKFLDAAKNFTPSVTTAIGIEGISGKDKFPGFVEEKPEEIARKAVLLYTQETVWDSKQALCAPVLHKFSDKSVYFKALLETLSGIKKDPSLHREKNYLSKVLTQQNSNATKYFSKWIEEKNKKN